MSTNHKIYFNPAQDLSKIEDGSINLIVTSPPYPMIEMWDNIMSAQNPLIAEEISSNGPRAFELMHLELDKVWKECYRVLSKGGFMCINIGDATRTVNGNFNLYNNHSRIVQSCINIGFENLPNIIWRKQTNAPNKFMGSGMLPCGAYVTLEHEWILIFRKGGKRDYKTEDAKQNRRSSAFFWEERNIWFSDLWEIKGVRQKMSNNESRERNASFPMEIPYRLINMYSQKGDIVLDPFYGLGTTSIAAILSERNSIGIEIDKNLSNAISERFAALDLSRLNDIIFKRLTSHNDFIASKKKEGKTFKYYNTNHSTEITTKQELEIALHYIYEMKCNASRNDELSYTCSYCEEYADMSNKPKHEGLLF